MSLIYMAKPTYGGWVSFTAHLSLKYKYKVYKIGKRTEKLKSGKDRLRNFGYGVTYQNISIEDAIKLDNILITAIDKNYYKYLNHFKKARLVIHDPTEIKGKSCQPVIDHLNKFKIITIRKSVKRYLSKNHNIKAEFKVHPFYSYPVTKKPKMGAVSISRIDFDKHIEVILEANKLLPIDNKIEIYGAANDRYVYFKLKPSNLNFEKYYKGKFKKSFVDLDGILSDKEFVVDLSAIKNDGGGSQYTFLEAIYQNCILVLSSKWLVDSGNIFINNVNCMVVENSNDIVKVIMKHKELGLDPKSIIMESKKILEPHIKVKW